VDRSLGRKLAAALTEAGFPAVTHDSIFPDDATPDTIWLARVGKEEWLVITKDKLIRKRPLEREALIEARVRAFVFSGGNMSGVEMAEVIIGCANKLLRIAASTPAPFVARITGSGDVEVIDEGEAT
jgi:predicted nuclease of predicted toxin-antitoxin system